MGASVQATVKLMIGQTPVEFQLNAEGGVSFQDIKDFVDAALINGFQVPKQWQQQPDMTGKKGTVRTVVKDEGGKMWTVTADMDDGTPFAWKEFSPTAFRLHDRMEVFKNDRGFKQGRLINDAEGSQKPIPF